VVVTTSQLLFLVGLGCGVLFAALAVYAQVRGGGRLRDVHWGVPVGILVFGALFGGGAYLLDSDLAEQTLFEVVADGSAAEPVVREFEVVVEHPGVVHDLLVAPNRPDDAEVPIDLHVTVADAAGRSLLDRPLHLEVDCGGRSAYCEWDAWYGEFTPLAVGAHRLTVSVLSPDVPTVHVRVGDPEKTDGVRAPGY